MAYEMVMPYHLHMPSYFLETFTEYPKKIPQALFGACGIFLLYGSCCYSFCNENPSIIPS